MISDDDWCCLLKQTDEQTDNGSCQVAIMTEKEWQLVEVERIKLTLIKHHLFCWVRNDDFSF